MTNGYFSFDVKAIDYDDWCREALELWEQFLEASFRLEKKRSGTAVTRNSHEAKVAWEVICSPLKFSRYIGDFVNFVSNAWGIRVNWEWSSAVPAGASWIWCDSPAAYVICAKCTDPQKLSMMDQYRRTRILLHELSHLIDPQVQTTRSSAAAGDWFAEVSPISEVRAWWFAFTIIKLIQSAYALYYRNRTGTLADDQTANMFI